jgi:hypothetical protein
LKLYCSSIRSISANIFSMAVESWALSEKQISNVRKKKKYFIGCTG